MGVDADSIEIGRTGGAAPVTVYWTVSKVHFRLLALALAGVRLEKRSEVSVLF
jgi:hypothetical protein